jgi:predicted O-methyltransferase YrrM
MGTLSKYERLAQDAPFEPITCREFDFDISTDLPNLDEFVYEHSPIDALRVSAAGRPVGRIAPYAPGEALRAPHIKHLLVSCFGSSVLAELATRNQLSDGVPVYRSAVMQVSPSKTEDKLRSPNSGSFNEKSRRPSFLARAVQSIRAPLNAVVSADAPEGFPAGHFYSPIARLTDVVRREQKIFEVPASLAGIDLNDKGQVSTITALARHFPAIHLSEQKQPGARFYYDNPNYGHGEALIYSSFLRELRPQRIVEIGSGFSTLLMLDTLEQIAATETQCICIEPYPELLLSLLGPSDIGRIEIHACEAQDASLQWFDGLDESDILFIDSTHVSKVGSDVHRLLFEVLPRLRAGVFVHFHDIFYPFEYPREWIFQGRNWNECYILRAFLQYNRDFSIVCFNSYLGKFHSELFCESKPLFLGNPGSSLWLRKL